MELYGKLAVQITTLLTGGTRMKTDVEKLCTTQAFWSKGSNQEDHTIRPFHVLSTHIARDEASEIFQPREHHLHS
jgi:hypothetical protein